MRRPGTCKPGRPDTSTEQPGPRQRPAIHRTHRRGNFHRSAKQRELDLQLDRAGDRRRRQSRFTPPAIRRTTTATLPATTSTKLSSPPRPFPRRLILTSASRRHCARWCRREARSTRSRSRRPPASPVLVNLSATGLPAGATASFNPASVNITDATAKTSHANDHHTAPAHRWVISQSTITGTAGSLDAYGAGDVEGDQPNEHRSAVSKDCFAESRQVGVSLSYRVTVTNNGPADGDECQSHRHLAVRRYLRFVFRHALALAAAPARSPARSDSLAVDATAIVTIVVTPTTPGQITNSATASASETDYDTSNNTATITTLIQPAAIAPSMLDPNLTVSTVVSGLGQPTSIALFGQRFSRAREGHRQSSVCHERRDATARRSTWRSTALPNAACSASRCIRILRSIISFISTGPKAAPASIQPTSPMCRCWAIASIVTSGTVPRSSFDRNLIKLRAYQADAGQPLRGNHNGGVLRFGPDGKLYILMGDNGRRGFLQNNQLGPVPDDQFGGPEPDDAHLTGFVLRLNDDGSTPADNPFFNASTTSHRRGRGEHQETLRLRRAQRLWHGFRSAVRESLAQENGDDAFDEMNRVTAGSTMVGCDDGTGQPGRRIQSDRINLWRRQSATVALAAVVDSRHARGRAGPALHVAGRALQRSGIQLEVCGRARGARLCEGNRTRPAV